MQNKTLIIVESPGKIKTIQKYLGDEYIVAASFGHIVDLAKGGKFGIGVDVIHNYKTYYTLLPDKLSKLDNIINIAIDCDKIIICSDPDLEGEAIAYALANKLEHLNKPIFRAQFNEITKEGVQQGLKNYGQLNKLKADAQETRRVLDRIVGFMVSPFLINYYGTNLSAGRVQSVTTKLIVDREKEISSFIPKENWNLLINLNKDNKDFSIKLQSKIKNKEEALKFKEILLSDNNLIVDSIVSKSKKEKPPAPLTTAKLQQIISSKFGMSGDEIVAAAQNLYELGYCSYIRTDSTRISDTALKMVREWLTNNNLKLPKTPNVFKNKDASQDAHECLRPTVVNNLPDQIALSGNEQIMYKVIWSYFVASQMEPAIFDINEIIIKHPKSGSLFKISGKVLIEPGFLQILKDSLPTDKNNLPELYKEEKFSFNENQIKLEQKFTQPPPRYNYATLIAELENKGIGRPSTYNNIVTKISDRKYVEKDGNVFYPTELGNKVCDLLSNYFNFMSYDYTASLEQELDNISLGKCESKTIIDNFFKSFKNTLCKAHTDCGGKLCDICGLPINKRLLASGDQLLSCFASPFCKNLSIIKRSQNQADINTVGAVTAL